VTDREMPGDDLDLPLQEEPDEPALMEEPGYLTVTGEAVGDDGSVVPIVGGLPAVEGSAWDVGAPADERGADLLDAEQNAYEHGHGEPEQPGPPRG
jgi:hypothetical protein